MEHQMGIVFLAPETTYICGEEANVTAAPVWFSGWLWRAHQGQSETALCPCEHPVYDRSVFTNTIVMNFDLICARKWMISFSQIIFQFGTLLGSVCFGAASDRFGRKKPLLVCVTTLLIAGFIAAYADDFWAFSIVRLIVGASIGGMMVTTWVLLMEFIGAKHRDTISALYQVPFNFGHIFLALVGYLVRDYKVFLLVITLPGAILLSYYCLVPESARWLIAVGRTNEAIPILERVAKWNKLLTDIIRTAVEAFQGANSKQSMKKGTLPDLFRYAKLRKHIICMSLNWLACSYCFYEVSQYVGQLSGNMFLNVALSACLGLIGSLVSIPLLKMMGRRTILIVNHFISSACLIILTLLGPTGQLSVAFATIGVMASFIVFVTVYLHCGEIFPTVFRNAAVGFCSMMARIGSMVAPFVLDTQDFSDRLPPVLFAVLPFVAGCLAFLLPETKGRKLLTTIEEHEERINR